MDKNKHKKLKFIENNGLRDLDIISDLDKSNYKKDIVKGNDNTRYPKTTCNNNFSFIMDTDEENKGEDYRDLRVKKEENCSTGANYTTNYVSGPNKVQGRGFGDFDLDLRLGLDTRKGENISNIEISDFHFEKLSRNYQNPNNIVLPFPRGGVATRDIDKFSKYKQ
jgi:hypothetical protein